MNFQVIKLLRSCLVSLILTPFLLTKWLTQIFVDCNRFNKAETNENGPLKEHRNKRRTDKAKTKLNETTLHKVFTQVRQSMTIRCNRTYISFEAIALKLISGY